jgi:hypothetical protein
VAIVTRVRGRAARHEAIAAAVLGASLLLLLAGCGSGHQAAYQPAEVDGLRLPARVASRMIEAATKDGWRSRFWPGIDLGATVPGRSPGEVAPTRADYDRWLAGIGEIGGRLVRVYTILRPSFYDALAAYNAKHASAPLFLLQGVWIPEEEFLSSQNAYAPAVTRGMDAEIRDIVAVVHGDADLPPRPGHADGKYRSDVSPWLLGWSLGIEWDPHAVQGTNKKNAGEPPYAGRYVTATAKASPMESWIAARLDVLAGLEAKRGWSRPVTFTNWLTVDPLHHPDEPLEQEDLVSLDATHLAATAKWPGGFFASYHAYPYYPDFLRLQSSYQTYKRPSDGEVDPYAGYLHALRAHHGDQAVMITEFGLPSGIGVAHVGPLGRDQGDHSEQEQGDMDARLLQDIQEEGYAGGLLFEWVDEWFKKTWNTAELELPADRRQMWRNDLTNEEQFGIVAAESGTKPVATLDGKGDEWTTNGSQAIAEARSGPVRQVRAVKDAQSLWLELALADPQVLDEDRIVVGLDMRPGGNKGLPGLPGVDPAADVALTIGPGRKAELRQAAWWEPTRLLYGVGLGQLQVDEADFKQGSGVWVTPLQILNRPYTVPSTGQKRAAEVHDLGTVRFGSAADDIRSLVDASGKTVEIRLPYMLLGFSDPSSKRLFVQRPDGRVETIPFVRAGIAVHAGGRLLQTSGYSWDPWNKVDWHERRKAGFATVRKAMEGTWNG